MATEGPGRAQAPTLTSLPRLEDLPVVSGGGYDVERTREAFEAFRRHTAQMQAQLRVLQAAGRTANVEPTGHAVRMDALHLIRSAAEFADILERDAQSASAAQLQRTEEEITRRQQEIQAREAEVERYRQESERQRSEILTAAKNEARDLLARSNAEASQELREAEARASRLREQARHQATDLTNAARAEVEQTLEWARAQAGAIMARAQQGAEQFLQAAGLGQPDLTRVVDTIIRAAEREAELSSGSPQQSRPAASVAGGPPISAAPAAAPEPPVVEPPAASEPEPVAEGPENARPEVEATPQPAPEAAAPPVTDAPPPVTDSPPPVSPAAPPVSSTPPGPPLSEPFSPPPVSPEPGAPEPAGDDDAADRN